MNSSYNGTKPAPASTSYSSPSKDILSFPKSRKANQNLYTPFPLSSEQFQTQNPSPSERTGSSRVSRNPRVDPSIVNISDRRTSVRRRTSTRANGVFPPRSGLIPAVLVQTHQPVGVPSKVNGIDIGGFATPSTIQQPPTSPIPKQLSPRETVRPSLMKRLTRRLQAPRSQEDKDLAPLPVQRVASSRRRSTRVSYNHRTSRRISIRNSGPRPPSAHLSCTPSGIGGSRSPSTLLGAIGSAALEENHSDYSTDSEQDEQPIIMRSPRLERARASALTAALSPSEGGGLTARLPARDPVADLIEQITGRLEGRISRDTISSAYDFSLNDYCNAFPAPPTPGTAPGAPWETGVDYADQPHEDISPLAGTAVNASFTPPVNYGPSLRNLSSHPSLGASNAEIKLELTLKTSASWDNWSTWPESTPASNKPGPPLVVTKPHTNETQIVVNAAERHQSVSTQFSIASSGPSSPGFPATPPMARPRSQDPLSQARRKTRIVCGHVLDGADNDDELASELATGHASDYFAGRSPIQDGVHGPTGRRGSDKSSFVSSFTHARPGTHAPSASTASYLNAYSLNSLSDDEDESANIGVALTTEFREVASLSPISFSEREDTRLTLYARRKGRKPDSVPIDPPLRVKPPPLLSHAQNIPSSAVSSLPTSLSPGGSSTFEGGIITPNIRNDFVTGRTIPLQPPKPAASKRKSFFRYPFSSQRSTGSLKATHIPTNVHGAPPLASPRAKDLPMSATADKFDFSPHEPSVGGRQPPVMAVQPSAHPIRYTNPTSRFISFSRPSSSRGKVSTEKFLAA